MQWGNKERKFDPEIPKLAVVTFQVTGSLRKSGSAFTQNNTSEVKKYTLYNNV